jgi:hypothetical protein
MPASNCAGRGVARALVPAASALMPTLFSARGPTAQTCRDESRHGRHECLRHIGRLVREMRAEE